MAEQNRIDRIISDPLNADLQDLQYLEELVDRYPYAQFLRILISKISQNLDDLDQVNRLNSAAIYSADRSVLKNFFTRKDFKVVLPENAYQIHNIAFDPLTWEEDISEPISEQLNELDDKEYMVEKEPETKDQSKKIFNEVLRNLDVLKKLRNKYIYLEKSEEETISESDTNEHSSITPVEDNPAQIDNGTNDDMDIHTPSVQDDSEMSVSGENSHEEMTQQENININDQEEEANTSDPNYQKKLIDSFIVRPHMIARNSNKENDDELQEDLSLQSLVYESDIVSENLAEIFVKQEKKEKAIEIYKKLIWKFPQKKAYFAARIKELKG